MNFFDDFFLHFFLLFFTNFFTISKIIFQKSHHGWIGSVKTGGWCTRLQSRVRLPIAQLLLCRDKGPFNNYLKKMRKEGVKNVCFCPRLEHKNYLRREGGQKMVKFCPRSCWMTPNNSSGSKIEWACNWKLLKSRCLLAATLIKTV